MRRHLHQGAARRRRPAESGQAMVEFALILFPLLILVAGIIQFGIGLNYWLDMQRIANQGARWAAVNNWPPDCPRSATSCGTPNTLQEVLVDEAIADGLQDSVSAEVCYPAGGPKGDVGEPVRVTMETPFTFVPLLNIGTITLRAHATMRLEQEPTLISNEVDPCS